MDVGANRQENDHKAFLSLFVKNQKRIYQYILALCPNYQDADDIFQETVGLMWEKFNEYEEGTNFTAWAAQIARFKVLNRRRKKGAMWLSEEAMDSIQALTDTYSDNYELRLEALQKCLLKLPEKERALIALRYEHNKRCTSIAQITNRSVNGIYNTMARVHRSLRQCVQRALKNYGLA